MMRAIVRTRSSSCGRVKHDIVVHCLLRPQNNYPPPANIYSNIYSHSCLCLFLSVCGGGVLFLGGGGILRVWEVVRLLALRSSILLVELGDCLALAHSNRYRLSCMQNPDPMYTSIRSI